jgi:4-diphosphocytidyl-2-C-methyl-D-erythritol kinase
VEPRQIRIRAPAKINLALRVLGKRDDGFHEIETLLVAVDLYDRLDFARTDSAGVRLQLAQAGGEATARGFPLDESNLIIKAIREFERHTQIVANLAITVHKQIPIAAGLGGGSADAAATLRALQILYGSAVDPSQLQEWAAAIGSDVPFFLGTRTALGTGRGEQLTPVELFTGWWAVLVCPAIFLSAKEVYGQLGLTRPWSLPRFDQCRDGEGFFVALRRSHNDLEEVVNRRVPVISCCREALKSLGAEGVLVSGSGPSVFGVFWHRPPEAAVQALRACSKEAQVFVVRPVSTTTALSHEMTGSGGRPASP